MIDILKTDITEIERSATIKTFGLIVYNDENPNIIRLLRDEDNWKALSKVSGEKFYIFSVKPKKGLMEFPPMSNGLMGMLVKIWQEPTDNNLLLQQLEIESTKELPLFFVFTKVGPYLLHKSMKIDESNVDVAFSQLKEIFYKIREVSDKIHSEYQEHDAQVHDKIAEILQKHNAWKKIKTIGGLISAMKRFTPSSHNG